MPSWEFFFCFFINYAYICTCIRRHLKETIPSSSITWSEMGKQNMQAKVVYCANHMVHFIRELHGITLQTLYTKHWEINTATLYQQHWPCHVSNLRGCDVYGYKGSGITANHTPVTYDTRFGHLRLKSTDHFDNPVAKNKTKDHQTCPTCPNFPFNFLKLAKE